MEPGSASWIEANAALVKLINDSSVIWNARLAKIGEAATKSVASQMSQLVASHQLQTAAFYSGVAETIGKLVMPRLTVLDDLAKTLSRSILPTASIAALNFAEMFERLDSEHRELDSDLRRFDWWIPPSWDPSITREVVEFARRNGKRALDRELSELYRDNRQRRLRRMVDAWMEEPAFRSRRPIIQDALRDHASERFRVSVPTLLPLIEGIAVEVFEPSNLASTGLVKLVRGGILTLAEAYRALDEGLVEALGVLWQRVSFQDVNPRSRHLNRHLVLHGRTYRYGTEANSLRIFFALDLLASQVGTKRRADARKPKLS